MKRKKSFFSKLADKLPVVVVIISLIVGGFFGYKIIRILTMQEEGVKEVVSSEKKLSSVNLVKEQETPKEKKEDSSLASTVTLPPPEKKEQTVQKPPEEKTTPAKQFFTIQVASFRKEEQANFLAEELKEKGFNPLYIKQERRWFKVWVGKFATRKQAKEYLFQLKKEFDDAFLRPLKKPFTPAASSSPS